MSSKKLTSMEKQARNNRRQRVQNMLKKVNDIEMSELEEFADKYTELLDAMQTLHRRDPSSTFLNNLSYRLREINDELSAVGDSIDLLIRDLDDLHVTKPKLAEQREQEETEQREILQPFMPYIMAYSMMRSSVKDSDNHELVEETK